MKVGDMVQLRVPYKDDDRIGIVVSRVDGGRFQVRWFNLPYVGTSIWPYSGLVKVINESR